HDDQSALDAVAANDGIVAILRQPIEAAELDARAVLAPPFQQHGAVPAAEVEHAHRPAAGEAAVDFAFDVADARDELGHAPAAEPLLVTVVAVADHRARPAGDNVPPAHRG